ncbi:hypothetical protein FGX01_05885, partial [Xylella fastidiosa subsp. multiplex]|nr:hypothetical protein [Xylella fastidiosa subsp. multiplex]
MPDSRRALPAKPRFPWESAAFLRLRAATCLRAICLEAMSNQRMIRSLQNMPAANQPAFLKDIPGSLPVFGNVQASLPP